MSFFRSLPNKPFFQFFAIILLFSDGITKTAATDPQSLKQPFFDMAHSNGMDAARRAAFAPDFGLDRSSAGENIGHYRLAVKFVNDPMGPGKKRSSIAGIMNTDDDNQIGRIYMLPTKINPRFAPQVNGIMAINGREMQKMMENTDNSIYRDY